MNKPSVICLCGSTRFKDNFIEVNRVETLKGKIVLAPGVFGHSGDLTPDMCERGHTVKEMLDDLHKRKIDMSDEILVINVDGYVGESTRSEIEYAVSNRIPVRWMDPYKIPSWFTGVTPD